MEKNKFVHILRNQGSTAIENEKLHFIVKKCVKNVENSLTFFLFVSLFLPSFLCVCLLITFFRFFRFFRFFVSPVVGRAKFLIYPL